MEIDNLFLVVSSPLLPWQSYVTGSLEEFVEGYSEEMGLDSV